MQHRQKKNATVGETVASHDTAEGEPKVLLPPGSGKGPSILDELVCIWQRKSILACDREQVLKDRVVGAHEAFVLAVAREACPTDIHRCQAAIDEANRALNRHRAEWVKEEAPLLRALRLAGDREQR